MGRSRSASVRKATPGWEGIHRFSSRDLFLHPERAATTYEDFLCKAPRLEVELGSGNGDFLLQAALKNPETLFVGIEYAQKFMRLIRDRVHEAGLINIQLVCAEGRAFLKNAFPNESIDVIHLYFPDPWPKKSNRHKRALSPEGQLTLHRVLKSRGLLYFSTDHEEYAETVRREIASGSLFQTERYEQTTPDSAAVFTAYQTDTHFGRKHLARGRLIHRFVFCRR